MADDFDDFGESSPFDAADVPFETRREQNPEPPAEEDAYGRGFRPSVDEKRMAYEILLIEGMSVKRAARALLCGEGTFRRVFSREISEAGVARAQMAPGENFKPTQAMRMRVMAMASLLPSATVCGLMFRGGMTESRFNELFGPELLLAKDGLKGLALTTAARVMVNGADNARLAAAKFVLKQKDLGGQRDTTRYDHAESDPNQPRTTKEQIDAAREEIMNELIAGGIEPALARSVAAALGTDGERTPREKLI